MVVAVAGVVLASVGAYFTWRFLRPVEQKDAEGRFWDEAEEVAKRMPFKRVRRGEEKLTLIIKRSDGQDITASLTNLWLAVRDLGEAQREARLALFFKPMLEIRAKLDWAEAESKLLPLVRPVSTLFHAKKKSVAREWQPFLVEIVGVDRGDAVMHATEEDLAEWGQTAETAFAGARRNMAARVLPEDVDDYDDTATYPIFVVVNADHYEASRLLVPGWLASFRDKVHGQPIAVMPTAAIVVVSGDGDPDALRRLLDLSLRHYQEGSRPLSPCVYTVDDAGEVVPYVKTYETQDRTVDLRMIEYRELQNAIGKTDPEARVASCSAISKKNDPTDPRRTYCVWQQGPLYLPETDLIAFSLGEGDIVVVPWTAAVPIVGHLLQLVNDWPLPLHRASRLPSDEEMEKLRAVEIPR